MRATVERTLNEYALTQFRLRVILYHNREYTSTHPDQNGLDAPIVAHMGKARLTMLLAFLVTGDERQVASYPFDMSLRS